MPYREKVIKAIECCSRPAIRKCNECPYESYCYHDSLCDIAIHDALALLNLLKEQETANVYKCPNCGTWVSAENVVRCKDCKYWDYRTEGCMHLTGRIAPIVKTGANWYCHDGERKDT